MKILKNKLFLGLVAGSVVISTGCKRFSEFGDTNVNPAATTTPITSALLTNALALLGTDANNNSVGTFGASDKAGIFAQYFSEATYPTNTLYSEPVVEFDNVYYGPLYDLQNILNVSTNPSEKAVARIVKAYYFWRLTDRWGDIPYFDALKGTVPTYDRQELIYKDLIKEVTEAVSQFDEGGTIKGDIIYNNDASAWKRFANSLHLLMALRLSERYPGSSDYAATEFRAALAMPGGVIETNAQNFQVNPTGSTIAFSNPFWYSHDQQRDYGVSELFMGLLTSTNDTRVTALASSTVGVPYGYTESQINSWRNAHPTWARTLSDANRTATSPVFLVTAAEVDLARAEAADRGWTSEDMNTLYTAGITASFNQWGLTVPASYLSQPAVALTAAPGTNANLPKIAVQEFIAAFPDGIEGWSIWRRTGYPVLTPSPNPADPQHSAIPRRYVYGLRQRSLNPEGIATAVQNQGADVQETHVWWDLN